VGIRTPWSLASEAVWIRTHRFGARLLSAVSAAAAISFALLVVALAAAAVYSLVVSKRLGAEPLA
jgi:uncharacterized membrane protein